MSVQRRLLREFKRISEESGKTYTVAIDPKNIMVWNVKLFGPDSSIWDGGIFPMTFEFPQDYPHSPPTVHFIDTIPFHPNVYANGKICIDILQHNWSSAYGVNSIITSVLALLNEPNPNSPANNEAAKLFTGKKNEYTRRVRECVEATWSS